PEMSQGVKDAKRVVDPVVTSGDGHELAGMRHDLSTNPAEQPTLVVRTSSRRHPNPAINGSAKDGPAIIVRVIADELDPARGSGNDFGFAAKGIAEQRAQFLLHGKRDHCL